MTLRRFVTAKIGVEGDLASGGSVLDQFGLLSASFLQFCFVFASSTIDIKAKKKRKLWSNKERPLQWIKRFLELPKVAKQLFRI